MFGHYYAYGSTVPILTVFAYLSENKFRSWMTLGDEDGPKTVFLAMPRGRLE